MRVLKMGMVALMLVAVVVSGIASSASAAHLGNNRAVVSGTAVDPDATGKAVVNYSKGQGAFNGTITVRNLEPGGTYTFQVSGAASGEGVNVCEGVANSQGTFTCSFQGLNLGGFTTAEVEGANGGVASGIFDRAGNCRAPDQDGSLCHAPGQN